MSLKRNTTKKSLVVLMSCSMAVSNMIPMSVLANNEIASKVNAFVNGVKANGLTDFSGKDVSTEGDSVKMKKTDGDNFAVYNGLKTKTRDFKFSADVIMNAGGMNNATLLFGIDNKDNPSSVWKGANVIKEPAHEPDKMRVFKVPYGNDYVNPKQLEGYDATKKMHLELDVKEDGTFVYTVQSEGGTKNTQTGKMDDWAGGYIGLLTLRTEAVFSNIQFEDRTENKENTFQTNLDNLRGLNGTWDKRGNGLFSSGGNDNFATSDTKVANFEYSANIKNEGGKGAGALLFRVQNPAKPNDGCYVVNVDYTNKVIKLFEFPSGNTIKEVPLSSVEANKDGSYDIKVYAVGDDVYVFANGKGIMRTKIKSFKDGNLGLLTWNGSVTYKDVNYKATDTLPVIEKAELSGLEIKTPGVTITPQFDKNVRDYGMDIPAGTGDVTLKPTSTGKMFVTFTDRNGKVSKEKTEVTDTIVIKPEDFEVNYLNMIITIEKDGFSESINFAVNQWLSLDELANQEYRSQFHVTPQVNFMNDPNGMVYDPTDGYWHMHYQYSPKNTFYKQSWAHVRSKDLVNWEQMPLSLQIDEIGVIFSGSAISLTEEEAKDPNILEGVFNDNKPGESRLVSFFTYDKGRGYETQSLAYSKDHGTTWKKIGRNVIENPHVTPGNPLYGIDFRDPKVFKVPGDDTRWYMTLAGGEARVFVSENLIDWEPSQVNLYDIKGNKIASECPGLNPVTIEGTKTTKWVYNGSDGFYIVGDMIKDEATGIYKWKAESEAIGVDSNENPWGGFGKYANMTFYEDGAGKGRYIGMSWLQDNGQADFEGKTYWGLQTLPFEWGLKQRENGEYVVINKPVEEINLLRDTKNVLYQTKDKKVSNKDTNILQGVSGIRYDVEGVFTLGSAKEFGFKLRKGNGQELIFKYDTTSKKMYLDMGNVGYSRKGNYSYDLIPLEGNKVKLRVIIDQGAIEAFGNDGEASISTVCYTNNDNIGMEFYTVDGDVTIDSLNIYDMKSMYSGKSGSESADTKLFLSAPKRIEIGNAFTIDTNIYPNLSKDQKINWTFDKGLVEVSKDNGSITLKADKAGFFKVTGTTSDGKLSKEITVEVKKNLETNIVWPTNNSAWNVMKSGIVGKDVGGDSFLISDQKIYTNKPFVLETDINIQSGYAAGIVFGVNDKNNVGAHWFCANIDVIGKTGKLFKNQNGQKWFKEQPLPAKTDGKSSYNVKLVYDGKGTLIYYLDGVEFIKQENAEINDGYVGIQTFRSEAAFESVNVAFPEAVAKEITTKVDDMIVDYNANKEDIRTLLPTKVNVVYDNGASLLEAIDWNLDAVDMKKSGTYEVVGTSGNLQVKFNVFVGANKEALQTKLDSYKDYKQTDFTKKSWTAFNKFIDDAQAMMEHKKATQAEVDTMLTALTNAKDVLVKVANKEALKVMLDTAKNIKSEGYTKASFKALQEAIKAAEGVFANDEATQAEVDTMLTALTNAKDVLVKVANKEDLKVMLDTAKNIKSKGYTKDSFTALQEVIKAAEGVFANDEATDAEVLAQVEALSKAISNLKKEAGTPSVVDKSTLQDAINKANKMKEKDYTASSWKAFEKALATAKSVLGNANATDKDVVKAILDLSKAQAALVKKSGGVDTGDSTNFGLLAGMMALSGVAVVSMKKGKKKASSK